MFFRALLLLFCLLVCPISASAEGAKLKLPNFTHLQSKASESVDISIGGFLLKFASHFMSKGDADDKELSALLADIKSVRIRSYEFKEDNAYSPEDVESVRKQLADAAWNQIAHVHDRKDNEQADIYIHMENGEPNGLAIISSEAREFTIVNVVGRIDLEKVGALQDKLRVGRD